MKIYLLLKCNCIEKTKETASRLNVKPVTNDIVVLQKDISKEKELLAHIAMLRSLLTDEYCFILQYSLKVIAIPEDGFISQSIIDAFEKLEKEFPTSVLHFSKDGSCCDLSYDYRSIMPRYNTK